MESMNNNKAEERVQPEDPAKKPVWTFEDYIRDFMSAAKSQQPPMVGIARGLANLERLTIALEKIAMRHGHDETKVDMATVRPTFDKAS